MSTRVSAQVGSHLGEGDTDAQLSNMDHLKSNGAGDGFPVTIMINANTASANQDDLRKLAEKVSQHQFKAIVRLTHVCEKLDQGSSPSQAVTNVKQAFGGSLLLVIWGNEVNNEEVECASARMFVDQYNSIANKENVAPGPIDFYNGNYKPEEFLAKDGVTAVYQNSPIRAANAYGCVGEKDGCQPASTATQGKGYKEYPGGTSAVILTEFSLSPEGRVPGAPDTNLQNVVTFIQTRFSETGAQYATPLVRNVCNSEGEWLLYVNGKLITKAGTDVTNNCSGLSGGSGYDLSRYPEYQDDLGYYISGMAGLTSDNTHGKRSASIIRHELAMQGYDSYCAADPYYIKAEFSPDQYINWYFERNPSGIEFPLESSYPLSAENVKTPLFRDVEGKRFLTSSLEEYFGFKDVYSSKFPDDAMTASQSSIANVELTSAPINSLLSDKDRCVQTLKLMEDYELVCTKKLASTDQCNSFYGRKIPGYESGNIQYSVDQLKEKLNQVSVDGWFMAEAIPICEKIYDPTPNNPYSDLKPLVSNMNLHAERFYRWAFLVVAIEREPEDNKGPFGKPLWSFFSKENAAAVKHDVLIVAFKVPDIGTNKSGNEDSGSVGFSDPFILTRNSLLSTKQISKMKILGEEYKSEKSRNAHREGKEAQGANDQIQCIIQGTPENSFTDGVGSPACKDEMGKALVDFINGNTIGCSTQGTERVQAITDSGTLDQAATTGFTFDPMFGDQILKNLLLNRDLQKDEFTGDSILQSHFNLNEQTGRTAQREVKFFIVYPVGYDLHTFETVLKNSFFTKKQIANLEKDPNFHDRLSLQGLSLGSVTASRSLPFVDDRCPYTEKTIIDEETGEETVVRDYLCEITFALKDERKNAPTVVGGAFGFWVRKTQLSLNGFFTESYAYYDSCKTTEDFLLGSCVGGSKNLPPSGATIDTAACPTAAPDSGCSVEDLIPYFREAGFTNPEAEADIASRICQRESGTSGYIAALNDNCFLSEEDDGTFDYSVGFFQINGLAHCPKAFHPEGKIIGKLPCEIIDQSVIDSCLNPLYFTAEDAALPLAQQQIVKREKQVNNIKKMIAMRKSSGWAPWAAPGHRCEVIVSPQN